MDTLFILLGVLAGIGELFFTFRFFFSDLSEYFEAWRYLGKPDLWSALNGEYWDDKWAEMKLGIFHTGAIAFGAFAWYMLKEYFG